MGCGSSKDSKSTETARPNQGAAAGTKSAAANVATQAKNAPHEAVSAAKSAVSNLKGDSNNQSAPVSSGPSGTNAGAAPTGGASGTTGNLHTGAADGAGGSSALEGFSGHESENQTQGTAGDTLPQAPLSGSAGGSGNHAAGLGRARSSGSPKPADRPRWGSTPAAAAAQARRGGAANSGDVGEVPATPPQRRRTAGDTGGSLQGRYENSGFENRPRTPSYMVPTVSSEFKARTASPAARNTGRAPFRHATHPGRGAASVGSGGSATPPHRVASFGSHEAVYDHEPPPPAGLPSATEPAPLEEPVPNAPAANGIADGGAGGDAPAAVPQGESTADENIEDEAEAVAAAAKQMAGGAVDSAAAGNDVAAPQPVAA